MREFDNQTRRTGFVRSMKLLGLLLVLCFVTMPFALQANNLSSNNLKDRSLLYSGSYSDYLWETIGITNSIKLEKVAFVAGDFSLDFVASAPLTYDHTTGGGFYDDRTIGRDKDVVESLEGGDFTCGDRVTYLTAITVKNTATGTQVIELDYSYLAASTGQRGVALADIALVQVNTGDPGMIDNGETATATLKEGTETINGDLFVKPATLTGTVTVTGLDAGDVIIVRMDVIIACEIPSSPTGNLQGAITGGRVTFPTNLSNRDTNLSIGQQTVPFKNVNLIGQGACTLNDYTDACAGDIKEYTAGSSATTTSNFAWTLVGDAVFVDGDGNTISNPGNSATARVKATAPTGGTTGCYKVTVAVTADQHTAVECCDLVTVYAIPPAPTVDIVNPTICGTTAYGSVTVTCPLNPATGDPIYEYQNGSGAWQTSPVFGSIAAGAQFSIKVRRIGTTCESAVTDCTNYSTRTCTTPTVSSCGLTACPTTGTASLQTESSSSVLGDVNDKDMTAYPVPFSDRATVEFKADRGGLYVINLYDMRGILVKQLKSATFEAGESQKIEVDGRGMAEGMYLIRVESAKGAKTLKLLKKE